MLGDAITMLNFVSKSMALLLKKSRNHKISTYLLLKSGKNFKLYKFILEKILVLRINSTESNFGILIDISK